MTAGTHGSTYGGNPLACAVAAEVLDHVGEPDFLADVRRKAGLLNQGLIGLIVSHPDIFTSVAGNGLMLGLKCKIINTDILAACYEKEFLAVPAADNVLRLLPPLNIADDDIAEALTQTRSGGEVLQSDSGESLAMKHFLDINKTDPDALRSIIDNAITMKQAFKDAQRQHFDIDSPLAGQVVALIFEKPSTRTRVSFDVGVRQMGGQTMVLSGADMQLSHGETIADTARVMSRYVDLIMIRTFEEATLMEMAEYATVPVINGLTNRTHPCQIMANVMTFEEHEILIKEKSSSGLVTETMSFQALPMPQGSSGLTSPLQDQKRLTLNVYFWTKHGPEVQTY